MPPGHASDSRSPIPTADDVTVQTRFARAGDPNGGGATAWPRYDASTDPYIRLDLQTSTGMALKKDLCDFWDGLVR